LYNYAKSALFTVEPPLEQVHRRPCPKKEDECDVEVVNGHTQNHYARPSEIDRGDDDPCVLHVAEHL
jgi:hypothetical protein